MHQIKKQGELDQIITAGIGVPILLFQPAPWALRTKENGFSALQKLTYISVLKVNRKIKPLNR